MRESTPQCQIDQILGQSFHNKNVSLMWKCYSEFLPVKYGCFYPQVRFSKRQYVVMFCILSHFENDSVWKVTQLDTFQSVEVPISFAGLYFESRRQLKIVCESHTPIATKVCAIFVQCNFITYAIFLELVNCFGILSSHIYSDNFKQILLKF